MHVFWQTIIAPVFDILKPREVLEIGADEGVNTRQILSYCQKSGARAHVIDPRPRFDPGQFRRVFGDIFHFYESLSFDSLPLIEKMDAVLIDGDHNWYTVYHELRLIAQTADANQTAFPLIFLHDIEWPYGRRDLYYNPENIPAMHRNPYARQGLDPAGTGLKENGGFNAHLYHAIQENTPQNGVLTAVEDFMEASQMPLELVKIPAFHGLGILFPVGLLENADFAEFIRRLQFSDAGRRICMDVEHSRVTALAELAQTRQQVSALQKEKSELLKQMGAGGKATDPNAPWETAQTRKEAAVGNGTIAAYKRENAQMRRWLLQLRDQFHRLLQSRRWKLGHGLVRMLTLSGLRKNAPMATDHIRRIFSEFEGLQKASAGAESLDVVFFWKQNDSGLYGRRIDMLVKYLAKRPEVRKIALFDMPIASGALRRMADAPDGSHYQRLYRETALKNQGARDTEKVSCRTFVYKCGSGKMPQKIWRLFKKGEYLEFLKNRLRDMGIEAADAVFWFYPENPHISNIVKRFRPAASVVDLVDDHRTWPGISAARKLWLNRHYKGVLALADIAMTNCRTIQQDMGHLHPQIQLVPNACDPEPPPALSGNRAFDAFRRIPRPRIGYAGNLEQAKIDMDLIDSIARSRPEWQLVLIGSTHANPGVMDLDRHENVHFPGVVPYPDIKAWIREFDVAILPHLDSLQTRSMNPLKLYVYCSLGIPVVSTDVENIDAFRNVIAVAGSRQEFVGAVEKALERPVRDVSGEMKAWLEEHSWERRVDWIVGEIAAKAKPRRDSLG